MNKKTYCTPAINVAEGVLQPVLVSTSNLTKMQTQSFSTANEATTTNLNIAGYKAWTSTENTEDDEDFNF